MSHAQPEQDRCLVPGLDVSNTLGSDLQARDAETGLGEPSVPAPA